MENTLFENKIVGILYMLPLCTTIPRDICVRVLLRNLFLLLKVNYTRKKNMRVSKETKGLELV